MGPGSVRWSDLVNFVLGWAANRRPAEDRTTWQAVAEEAVTDANQRREFQKMGKTIADSFRDEGRAEGRSEGKAEGFRQGQAHWTHESLLKMGRRKFGEPDSATIDALRAIVDLARLDRLSEHLFTAVSWSDLLSTP